VPSHVVVVGASAAGLFAAGRLAAEGARVRVLEQASQFPPVARTLIATNRLRDVLGLSAEKSIVNEIRTFELFADGKAASVELTTPDLVVERSVLLEDLAERARNAGAEIELGRRFVGLGADGSLDVHVDDEPVPERPDHVIAADGAFSRVARAAGWADQTTLPLVQALVRCPAGLPNDTVRVWFRPEETPYFYWLIPDGEGRGALGLIGESRHDIRAHLDRFLGEKRLEPIAYQAARIPLYSGWRRVHRRVGSGSVHLVGDAAGHVKSSTVGGLVTGFRGARAAVDRIVGRRSRELRALRRELDRHSTLRNVLHRFGEPEYKRLLDLLSPPENGILAAHSRDETFSLLWRLCVREPRLALLAARSVLRRSR
jgi:flavin-dependent dehydrogenase